jgi:hypothetical protein
MKKDEALDLALKFVEANHSGGPDAFELIAAIKQALAAPVQEPVAWQVMVEDEAMEEFSVKDAAHDWCVQQKLAGSPYSYWIRPLYTTPTVQEFVCSTGLCHYKAKSDERLMETLKQEPDAYGYAKRLAEAIWKKHYQFTAPQWEPFDDLMGVLTQIDNMTAGLTTIPAAQRQWAGLTDEEWQDLSDRYGMIIFGRFKNEIETKLREKNTP